MATERPTGCQYLASALSQINRHLLVNPAIGMHVCMYACMYVCTYVCAYVRMYVCTFARTYECMYVCMYEVLEKANTISIEVHIHRHRFVGWVTLYCMENYLLAPALCISRRNVSKTLPRTHRHCAKLTIPTGN